MAAHEAHQVRDKGVAVLRLGGISEALEGARVGGKRPAAKGEDLLEAGPLHESSELVLDAGGVHVETGCDRGKGKVDVRVLLGRDLIDAHAQTRPQLVERLEVADGLDLGGGIAVVDNLHPAVGDAAVGVWLCGPGGASVRGRLGAEVGRRAAKAPDIAACVQGTGIQIRQCGAVGRPLGPRHLWAADGVGDRRRHRGVSLAEADELATLQVPTAGPAPGVFVEVFNVFLLQVVRLGQGLTPIVILDGICVTGAVGLGLRAHV